MKWMSFATMAVGLVVMAGGCQPEENKSCDTSADCPTGQSCNVTSHVCVENPNLKDSGMSSDSGGDASTVDAVPPPTPDTGVVRMDSAVSPVDATVRLDAAIPPVDATSPPVDAASPPADAGLPPNDAAPNPDAGPPPPPPPPDDPPVDVPASCNPETELQIPSAVSFRPGFPLVGNSTFIYNVRTHEASTCIQLPGGRRPCGEAALLGFDMDDEHFPREVYSNEGIGLTLGYVNKVITELSVLDSQGIFHDGVDAFPVIQLHIEGENPSYQVMEEGQLSEARPLRVLRDQAGYAYWVAPADVAGSVVIEYTCKTKPLELGVPVARPEPSLDTCADNQYQVLNTIRFRAGLPGVPHDVFLSANPPQKCGTRLNGDGQERCVDNINVTYTQLDGYPGLNLVTAVGALFSSIVMERVLPNHPNSVWRFRSIVLSDQFGSYVPYWGNNPSHLQFDIDSLSYWGFGIEGRHPLRSLVNPLGNPYWLAPEDGGGSVELTYICVDIPVDAGVVDAAVPPVDAAVPPVDAAVPPVDAAVPPVDAAVPPVDAAVPPVDAAVPPVDAAVPPVDAAVPPVDAAIPPVDVPPSCDLDTEYEVPTHIVYNDFPLVRDTEFWFTPDPARGHFCATDRTGVLQCYQENQVTALQYAGGRMGGTPYPYRIYRNGVVNLQVGSFLNTFQPGSFALWDTGFWSGSATGHWVLTVSFFLGGALNPQYFVWEGGAQGAISAGRPLRAVVDAGGFVVWAAPETGAGEITIEYTCFPKPVVEDAGVSPDAGIPPVGCANGKFVSMRHNLNYPGLQPEATVNYNNNRGTLCVDGACRQGDVILTNGRATRIVTDDNVFIANISYTAGGVLNTFGILDNAGRYGARRDIFTVVSIGDGGATTVRDIVNAGGVNGPANSMRNGDTVVVSRNGHNLTFTTTCP